MVRYRAHEDKLGLEALAFMSLGVKLDKDWKLRAGDWEAETLSTRQLEYTANDALVAVNIACVNVSNHLTLPWAAGSGPSCGTRSSCLGRWSR